MFNPLESELPLLSFIMFLFSLLHLLILTSLVDDFDDILVMGSKSRLAVRL